MLTYPGCPECNSTNPSLLKVTRLMYLIHIYWHMRGIVFTITILYITITITLWWVLLRISHETPFFCIIGGYSSSSTFYTIPQWCYIKVGIIWMMQCYSTVNHLLVQIEVSGWSVLTHTTMKLYKSGYHLDDAMLLNSESPSSSDRSFWMKCVNTYHNEAI